MSGKGNESDKNMNVETIRGKVQFGMLMQDTNRTDQDASWVGENRQEFEIFLRLFVAAMSHCSNVHSQSGNEETESNRRNGIEWWLRIKLCAP